MTDFTETSRGFKRYEPITTDYGHKLTTYESSRAMHPCLWLEMDATTNRNGDPTVSLHAHLTVEQAEQTIEMLRSAIDTITSMTNEWELGGFDPSEPDPDPIPEEVPTVLYTILTDTLTNEGVRQWWNARLLYLKPSERACDAWNNGRSDDVIEAAHAYVDGDYM